MDKLERHQGHFYNWYDTQTLKPLHPIYISTVDSGNLAGHLLTLQPGLTGMFDQPVLGPQIIDGMLATVRVLEETLNDAAASGTPAVSASVATAAGADGVAPSIAGQGAESIATPPDLAPLLALLAAKPDPTHLQQLNGWLVLAAQAAEALHAQVEPQSDAAMWSASLVRQSNAALDELALLTPWVNLSADTVFDTSMTRVPTLRELASLSHASAGIPVTDLAPAERERQQQLAQLLEQGSAAAHERMRVLAELAQRSCGFAQMEYGFLYNETTNLLAIGYNVSERRLDASYYDLLASEVRLASFIAIAQGQLPQDHWFALGRQLCIVGGKPVLLSWSGSMFEYLMPLLVMPTYESTLLDQTYNSVIDAQIAYGKQHNVPWGISESGYNTTDANLNYQYRAFGVPGLGLKRGLGDDLVIAPYATMMGLMVQPEASCLNLQKMAGLGFMGRYGFYEAIDYTASRVPRGQSCAVVRSFMVHHQGMGLLSLSYLLHDRPMQRRFESDPLLQSTLLCLLYTSPSPRDLSTSRMPSSA